MCGGLVLTSSIKPQRRNSDKRKEKSRDAARCRRNKESEIFQELQSVLPQDTSLDKTSMIRIAIGQMKLRHLLDAILPQNGRSSSTAVLDSCLPSLLRGFIVILSDDGNMVYLSETVCDYLGISQIEMIGNSIFDFTHPCDHDEVKSLLTNPQLDELDHQESISIFLRMKSSLKTSGKGIGLKPDPFQMMKCMGYKLEMSLNVHYSSFYVFLTVQPVFHGLQIVVPSNKQGFFSKHSPDMKFIEIDENIRQLFGYSSSDLIGKSLFEFQHATDSIALEKCYKTRILLLSVTRFSLFLVKWNRIIQPIRIHRVIQARQTRNKAGPRSTRSEFRRHNQSRCRKYKKHRQQITRRKKKYHRRQGVNAINAVNKNCTLRNIS